MEIYMKQEIRLSGSGGQGLITAGIILAKAAALYDGKNAVQSQSYGPEARGGASKAEVIISDTEINYPKVQSPDLLLALTQESLNKYIHDVKDDAIVIIDSMLVKTPPVGNYKIYNMPVIMSATDVLGSTLSANILALGIVNSVYKLVSQEALERTVAESLPRAVELNMKALKYGAELAQKG
jgi:2-oxoglutarate ferredoxin oxidoreductase subunit gamma